MSYVLPDAHGIPPCIEGMLRMYILWKHDYDNHLIFQEFGISLTNMYVIATLIWHYGVA